MNRTQVVNLRTIALPKIKFADAGWDCFPTGIKACPHLTNLNLTECGLGPKHSADLADVFSSGGCNITTLCLAKNGLTGATFYDWGDLKGGVDSNLDGISTLLAVLKKSQVICVDFSGCGLGPLGASSVADYVRDAIGSVASISLSGNMITGSTNIGFSDAKYDLDLSGIIAFGEAAAILKTLTSIDLSNCSIAAKGIAEVTKFISVNNSIASLKISGVLTSFTS